MSDKLRAVLFDMDGTLVDTEGMWWQACAAVAAELGLELAETDVGHLLGRPVEYVAAHLVRRASSTAPDASTLPDGPPIAPDPSTLPGGPPTGGDASALPGGPPTGGDGTYPGGADTAEADTVERVGARLTDAFAERIAGGVTPLPGAIRLLDDLGAGGVPTALVSASPRRIVDMVLQTVGAERFALVVAAEDTARGKPLPDPYLRAAAGLGVDPGECVAVEDSPTGLAAARAAGCQVVSVAGGVAREGVLAVDGREGVLAVDGLEGVLAVDGREGVLAVDGLEKVDLPLLRLLASGKRSIG
ncbi:HAD family phosphatase [Streptosporangium sp. NBC_01755]|uniref:HAD family hydrolase n=1 Tax=Streptosporangium sp. NBC_01755 TaxID=2975949 RepID=UPI002DDB0595|nr:HAD family phosphatase [Streptosporangium sp. NBC_01755]WSD01618.1 HAD family phosphatase [Streptosporangium sp. NBC_01755]